MDINEPSLMDVAHDTINSTRRSGAERRRALAKSGEGARGIFFHRKGSGLMRSNLCRLSKSNEDRRTIRFIKGDY